MSSNPTHISSGLQPGDKIDKYQIVELIGQGGMSLVWKGHDPLLDQFVAIKQISLESDAGDEESLRETFRSEAAVQKKLASDHANLVQIIDFIDEPRGLFIVMEYVDGVSLEQMLASNGAPMDQRQALGIVATAAVALDYLHKNQVVHRDLKPANILIPKTGGLKICDFGLATLLEDQSAMNIGTVRYMAPEGFSGQKVDGRADIYSLGLIAYELLAGRDSFNEAFKLVLRDQQNQALRWMKWHTNMRITPPALSKLNSNIPETLSELVARMMEKDPVKRVGSSGELVAAIKRHFANPQGAAPSASQVEAAAAVPATSTHATAKLPTKSKLPVILGVILLSQVFILGGFWLITRNQDTKDQQALFDAAKKRYTEASALFKEKKYTDAQEKFDALAEDPQWAEGKLGKSSYAMALWSAAEQDLLDAREAMKAKDHDKTLKTYQTALVKWSELKDLAEVQSKVGKIREKEDETSRRVSILQRLEQIKKMVRGRQFTSAYNETVKMLEMEFLLDEERQAALAIRAQLQDDEIKARRESAYNRARKLYFDEGNVQDALQLLAEAPQPNQPPLDELRQEILDKEEIKRLTGEGDKHRLAKEYDKAIEFYEKADRLRGDEQSAGKIQKLRAELYMKKAKQALADGNPAEAVQWARKTLKFEKDHPEAVALINAQVLKDDLNGKLQQAEAANRIGEYAEAIRWWKQAQAIQTSAAVASKIAAAQVRIEVKKGAEAYRKGDRAGALKILSAPNVAGDAEAATLIKRIEIENRFDRLNKNAKSAFDKGDYLGAKGAYREIVAEFEKSDIIGRSQVAQVKKMVEVSEYEHLMAQARQDIKLGRIGSLRHANGNLGSCYSLARKLRKPLNEVLRTYEQLRGILVGMNPDTDDAVKQLLGLVDNKIKQIRSKIGGSK